MLNKPYQEKESKVALHESRGIKVCSKNINRQYVIEEGSIITSMGTKVRGQQPVTNLKLLKMSSIYQHLQLEGLNSLKCVLQKGDSICKLDLKDAYFRIFLHQNSQRLVWIV